MFFFFPRFHITFWILWSLNFWAIRSITYVLIRHKVRSNQSILKEINPKYSLEGLMLKFKLQNFGYLMWRDNSFEKTLMLKTGREGDDRGQDGWTASLTQWKWIWASSRIWWGTGEPGMLHSMGSQRAGHTEWLNNNINNNNKSY